MMILDFEKQIFDLELKIRALQDQGSNKKISVQTMQRLQADLERLKKETYANLTPWQRVQIARHPERPFTLDYIRMMASDFVELHGDRLFADDSALVAGFATIDQVKMMVMGHQKGRDTKDNIRRNFGCAHPEGYRKAMRLMRMAEKFSLPVAIFVDTPGAYPGVGAEERGQAQAIAENIRDMAVLRTPVVMTIIGEGGSGGALGVGVADKVLILEHAYYSVISPEGCASILWRNSIRAPDAAAALKISGEHLLKFGIVEEVIPEPLGGAHRDPEFTAKHLKKSLMSMIKDLQQTPVDKLVEQRYDRFRKIGHCIEGDKV